MQIKYFSTAWADLKKSRGVVGKVLLLGLICFIPIFGQIVLFGYLFGWSRELAWRVDAKLPEHIFDNSDGKLYRRGFFALVIAFVFGIVPGILSCISNSLSDQQTMAALSTAFILLLIAFVISLGVNLFEWVGIMRMSLYNKLSAGFQISKIWKMIRRDTSGILRILGMYVLVGIIIAAIVIAVFTIIALVFFMPLVMTTGMGMNGSIYSSFALVGMSMIGIVGMLVALYATVCLAVVLEMLVASAMGHWVAQFDVALWKGQDDPMPFEEFSA